MLNWFLALIVLGFAQSGPKPPGTLPPPSGQPGTNPAIQDDTVDVGAEVTLIQGYLAPFLYDRTRYRDPFEIQGVNAPLEPGRVYGPFLPLQRHGLNAFKLTGVMWQTKKPVAVFKGPNDEEYRLTIKDYIGENFGYIASIREREVVVIQTIEEDGKRYSTTKVVFLE